MFIIFPHPLGPFKISTKHP